MSETSRTDLRIAEASVKVCGVLSEKKLELTQDASGKKVIRGYVVIKTDDTNFVTLNVWANEFTTNGEKNKSFENMETVLNEHRSIAEVGEEAATRVYCKRGNLEPNTYIGKEDLREHTGVRYRTSFLTKVAQDKYFPKAEFEVEGFVDSIMEEVNREGEPTGRAKFKIYVPTYRGVEPLEFYAEAENVDEFTNGVDRGQTAKFYGDIVNRTIVEKKIIKMTMGKDREEEDTTRIFELIVNGIIGPYDDDRAYEPEVIQKGLVERNLRLQKEKEEAEAKKKSGAQMGTMNGMASTTGRTLPRFTASNFANM